MNKYTASRSCCQTCKGTAITMALIALIEVAGASILSKIVLGGF